MRMRGLLSSEGSLFCERAVSLVKTIAWADGKVRYIDQTRLPLDLVILETSDYTDVAQAIRELRIRGAPAIGVAGAFAVALGAQGIAAEGRDAFLAHLQSIADILQSTRPTAVNLHWAVQRMITVARQGTSINVIKATLVGEARKMALEDEERNKRMGAWGAQLIRDGSTLLTHCNTGSLATVDYGTALGAIRAAYEQGKKIHVYVDETRPLLQGARLTAWELTQLGIPYTLITDSMAGYFLHKGMIDGVFVGADRIAGNGDVANKIGTYSLAVLAKENEVPFYVVAPTSTIDLSLPSGDHIPIEERSPQEVINFHHVPIAPLQAIVANPAFDVTPHRYITAIVTEEGILEEPYEGGLRQVVGKSISHG